MARRAPTAINIVQTGSGQQFNFIGGGGAVGVSATIDGVPVNLNEIFYGVPKDANKPVEGYTVSIYNKYTQVLLQTHQVKLDAKTPLEIKGAGSSRISLRATGTPMAPRLSMLVMLHGTSTVNSTSRGQCIACFQLPNRLDVRVVAAPYFKDDTPAAPAPAAAKPAAAAAASTPPEVTPTNTPTKPKLNKEPPAEPERPSKVAKNTIDLSKD